MFRPTKKQAELLGFIEQFIVEHGYGPSYREIMVGRNYSSVATVAVHVNNLVASGALSKKDRSARSLEIAEGQTTGSISKIAVKPSDGKWLVKQIESRFLEAEINPPSPKQIDSLYVLVGALKVLGFEGAANSFTERLNSLKNGL